MDDQKNKKRRMFWMMHKTTIIIVLVIFFLIVLSIVGLASLESFYRKLTIAQMPFSLLVSGIHAAIFVFMYSFFLRGSLSSMNKKSIKGNLVNVKWGDVIGVDEVKEEAREAVELIKDRTRVKKIGGKILRGLLMIGPPG
ncbi:MAG TPA: hypothetical protein VJC03_05495, partial [bacterium]|nr:hypothetical protein [bacterium]